MSAPLSFTCLTDRGPAGIAIVRIWGADTAAFIARHVRPSRPAAVGDVARVQLVEGDAFIDDGLITFHGQHPLDVQLHLHGNPYLLDRVASLIRAAGGVEDRDATPWPATDLLDAEAAALAPRFDTLEGVAWLGQQPARLRALVAEVATASEPERLSRCRAAARGLEIVDWFTRPLRVALVGAPNVGKSTLLNALASRPVSLVSPVAGTTRDWVSASDSINGFPVVWFDTAGMRTTDDPLEAAGVAHAARLAGEVDVICALFDIGGDFEAQADALATHLVESPGVRVFTKCDTAPDGEARAVALGGVGVSGVDGRGLDVLRQAVLHAGGRDARRLAETSAFTPRQREALLAGAVNHLTVCCETA